MMDLILCQYRVALDRIHAALQGAIDAVGIATPYPDQDPDVQLRPKTDGTSAEKE
jgi:hypothetical protein